MWVQLTSTQQISQAGKPRTYYPGDWVDVGKQTALNWVATGQAHFVAGTQDGTAILPPDGQSGVVTSGNMQAIKELLAMYGGSLRVEQTSAPRLMYDRTVILELEALHQPAMIGLGLQLLTTWEIAVPLFDYKLLAASVGTEEEREQTKVIIRDLRVPLYDVRMVFVRRTPTTVELINSWNAEPGERRLAFLRSVYKIKPFILSLPCTWSGHNAPQ